MMADFFAPQVLIRRAIARDKADVVEFTRFIWEGHDYVPLVWDDWYMDPHGILAVAEYAGHAVGTGKLTRLAEGQWWLEGLRVDPKFQGLKIGSGLHRYLEEWCRDYAGGTVRLMTSWERVEVQHLCDRFGWTKLGELKEHIAPARKDGEHALHPVAEHELEAALQFTRANLAHSHGLADLSWKSAAPDAELLREQCLTRRLWWWGAQAGLMGYWEDEDDGAHMLGVAFMACPLASLQEMLMDVRLLAGQQGYDSVMWLAPAGEQTESTLQAAGFESRWDGSAYVYAKNLEQQRA